MVRIAIMAASWPMSVQVGARVVLRILAPMRNPSTREKECPNSRRLAFKESAERPGLSTSVRYIFRALIMPIESTTIARTWHISTIMPLSTFIQSINVSMLTLTQCFSGRSRTFGILLYYIDADLRVKHQSRRPRFFTQFLIHKVVEILTHNFPISRYQTAGFLILLVVYLCHAYSL